MDNNEASAGLIDRVWIAQNGLMGFNFRFADFIALQRVRLYLTQCIQIYLVQQLGEIEARLAKHPAVREAVVIAREEKPGDKRLVAYYTTSLNDGSEANAPSAEQLRAFLSVSLPEYMVPAAFMALEAWPLTSNGKLDRRALPAPEMDFHAVHGCEPPQGDVETMLAAIWAETLRLDQVNRHDDFFRLGGHSLLTLRVVTLLQQRGIITIADIFANPTIASLAAKLKTRERLDSADIAIQINSGSADRHSS
jgi:hypothetical protein